MLKYLITIGLIYVVYRWVTVQQRNKLKYDEEDPKEIEYTDYEELDDK